MIRIENLHKAFGQNQVLKGIDLEIKGPGLTAILGPNGSGKTTLLKSVLGMVLPDKGDIFVNGESIKNKHLYRDSINYLPQIARFPENLKASEMINLIREIRSGTERFEKIIELFDLKPHLEKKLVQLSGGTRQKVNILQALGFENPIVVLDEPTAGLDPLSMIHLKDFIRKEKEDGRSILFTTHIMSLVEELADRIVYLLDGKIYFDGTVEELKSLNNSSNVEHAIASILEQKKAHFSSNGKSKKAELDSALNEIQL